MLIEEKLRPRLETIRPTPQIDLVRIQLEDLFFGKPPLDLYREKNLLELAPIGLLRRKKQVPRKLHRQRRSPLRPPARVQISPRRTQRTKQVHPPVPFEA